MLALKLHIHVTAVQEVASDSVRVCMALFQGSCEGPYFQGEIAPGGVDTQYVYPDGSGTLSARYMLFGTDAEGNPARLFIENNAVLGEPITHPRIRTDQPSLRWLETAALTGRITAEQDRLTIRIEAAGASGP